jgi:hypothetical protein
VISNQTEAKGDGYGVAKIWNDDLEFMGDIAVESKLDEIVQIGINLCKELYTKQYDKPYNKVNTDAWVNVVRASNPVQPNFKDGNEFYHTHTELNKLNKSFVPHYTYVYYIQMPDIVENDDGVLYFKSKDEKEYWIMPEVDDLIILEGNMPHAPQKALKSTIDRIVLAGNVGFDFIKKQKTFI